ncbi:hypothetical protein L7F22_059456 [Adiantum nelumboides]|nr:hypothetical protein [Adiantum nelumboides]
MGSTCVGVQYSTPRSRSVKPYVEAPRQVIGFDLSSKGGKSTMVLDSNDGNDSKGVPSAAVHSNCTNSCSVSSKRANDHRSKSTAGATSPRSALQQLLLPPIFSQSPPSRPSAADDEINLTHGPLLESIPAASSNWPICKGVRELVTPASRHASSINERKIDSSSQLLGGAVSAIKCLTGKNKESGNTEETHHELTWRSPKKSVKSIWDLEDQLHEVPPLEEKSKGSTWMKEAMISNEHPKSSTGIEIRWKQANMSSVSENSKKKSSLFVLAASSPTAEHTDENSSRTMEMEFLNSCYLCKRFLGEGHDVFMYSGDKGFCSMECRYQQIVIDERKERHAPPVIRSGASPIYQDYMVTAGAAARTTVATSASTSHHPIRINRPNFMNSAAAA